MLLAGIEVLPIVDEIFMVIFIGVPIVIMSVVFLMWFLKKIVK